MISLFIVVYVRNLVYSFRVGLQRHQIEVHFWLGGRLFIRFILTLKYSNEKSLKSVLQRLRRLRFYSVLHTKPAFVDLKNIFFSKCLRPMLSLFIMAKAPAHF